MFKVKKKTLLLIAGIVWLIAGFNVCRLGILDYINTGCLSLLTGFLSVVIFCLFGMMFYKMSVKHTKRIMGYETEKRPFYHFFDLKSYLIMIFMMSGGIYLRSSGIAPPIFVAFFYTGLGLALALAGALFLYNFTKVCISEKRADN